ncbi:MAG: hypothetical protein V4629_07160 [Pseudomonadota bacterium]
MTFPIQRSSANANASFKTSLTSQGTFAGRAVKLVSGTKPLLNHYVPNLNATTTNLRSALRPLNV